MRKLLRWLFGKPDLSVCCSAPIVDLTYLGYHKTECAGCHNVIQRMAF